MNRDLPIVLALTGASGVIYGRRLLEVLLRQHELVHLTISDSARQVIGHELRQSIDLEHFHVGQLIPGWPADEIQPVYHYYKDFFAPIASGSFRTRAMVVCPCSGGTLSNIARAAGSNLILRAAEVHLKERRPLILVPRETPLSLPQIENMRAATLSGATILPAMPGFYAKASSIDDLVDFVVSRILDQLGIEAELARRWGE